MSSDEDLEQSVQWHRPEIIGIVLAVFVALIAMFVFSWLGGNRDLQPAPQPAPAATQPMSPASANGEGASGPVQSN